MTRGRIGLLLLVIALAAALAWGFSPRAVPVDLVAAARGPLSVTVEEEGKTRVMERYVVSAPMAGYARRISVKVGDGVEAGQVLALLEPTRSDALDPRSRPQAAAQVGAAEAALAAAKENARAAAAEAELARRQLERVEALAKDKFYSAQAVDQAREQAMGTQAARRSAEHGIQVARFQWDSARAVLARSAALQAGAPGDSLSLRAPIRGRVLKVIRESEGTVRPGEPLLEVGNPESLEVEVEVLSSAAVAIVPGGRVLLDRWGGKPLQGRCVKWNRRALPRSPPWGWRSSGCG